MSKQARKDPDSLLGTGALPLMLDRRRDVPLYLQVRDALGQGIRNGSLPEGTRLPPVRVLAARLGVNQITVARAYKELAQDKAAFGRPGQGTFVSGIPNDQVAREPITRLTVASPVSSSDVLNRMLELGRAPGVINFTGGYPAAELIDTRFFARALNQAVKSGGSRVFHYDAPEGLPELQEALARLVARAKIRVSPADILVTTGGQQGLDIVARSLLAPGDIVITEGPTYFGALDVFRSVRANIISVDLDHDGPRLEALAKAFREYRPKLLFLIPTFHNPTGITTSLEKRRQILDLARTFGVAILEDDYCREMRYLGEDVPPIRALATDDDQVYYVRGIGKVYIPGMRVGFILAPRDARNRLVATKGLTDLHTSCLLQQGLVNYLSGPGLEANLSALRAQYGRRQRLLLDELQRQLPEEVTVVRPEGGLHLWLTLPAGESAAQFYFAAVQRGLAFVIGEVFYADRQDHGTFRLSFGLNSPEEIAEGAARLGAAARDFLSSARRRSAVIL